jgi:hypothetical protein
LAIKFGEDHFEQSCWAEVHICKKILHRAEIVVAVWPNQLGASSGKTHAKLQKCKTRLWFAPPSSPSRSVLGPCSVIVSTSTLIPSSPNSSPPHLITCAKVCAARPHPLPSSLVTPANPHTHPLSRSSPTLPQPLPLSESSSIRGEFDLLCLNLSWTYRRLAETDAARFQRLSFRLRLVIECICLYVVARGYS